MKRWTVAFVIVLLACTGIVMLHASGPIPAGDKDSLFILSAIKAKGVWSWFRSDWPLGNGFYRPVTSLSFVLDSWLYHDSASGYGLSAAIYCALSILALFWLARELTNSAAYSVASAFLFALWHTPFIIRWDWIAWTLAAAVFVVGFVRQGKHLGRYVVAALALSFIATELVGVHLHEAPAGFYSGVLHWLPARTATLMTLFALCSLAAYARHLRLNAHRDEKESSPLDLPATRTSRETEHDVKSSHWWLVLSACLLLFAFGSYEQAVMLPAVLFVVGIIFASNRYNVNWRVHLIFWSELLIYFVVRRAVLPAGISSYLSQQLRTGVTAYLSELNYVLPCTAYFAGWISQLSVGASVLLVGTFYSFPLQLSGNIAAYLSAFKNKTIMLTWLASVLAFLPMAFLKPFSHYHYWAMSLRAIFVVLLSGAIWQMIVSAVSPQVVQAPQRLSPAPGSLHRP